MHKKRFPGHQAIMHIRWLLVVGFGFWSMSCLADCGQSLTEAQLSSLKSDLQIKMSALRKHAQALLSGDLYSLEQRGRDVNKPNLTISENLYLRIDDVYDHSLLVTYRLDGAIELARLKDAMVNPADRSRIERSLASHASAAESEAQQAIAEIGTVTTGVSRPGLAADLAGLIESLRKIVSVTANCRR